MSVKGVVEVHSCYNIEPQSEIVENINPTGVSDRAAARDEEEIDFIDEDLDDEDLDEDTEEEPDPDSDPIKDQENENKREREQEELAADIDGNDAPAGELLPPDDDVEDEEDEKVDKTAGFYKVDGVIQLCVSCDNHLTVGDVKFDKDRCKRNEWKEPEEFVCQEEKCKEYRRAEQGEKSAEEEEGDAVDDVDAVYARVEDGRVVIEQPRVEGDGLVPILADIDDETPMVVRARLQAGIPLDFLLSESCTPLGCYPVSPRPALSSGSPSASSTIPVHMRPAPPLPNFTVGRGGPAPSARVRKIEDKVYNRPPEPEPIPPPKDETEAIEREVAAITEAAKKKREEEARKIVKKKRIHYKDKETPHLRLLCGLTTRALAAVLDSFAFNRPFRVLDRSLLYNMKTNYGRWYNDLQVYARTNGCNIRDAKRRAQYKYVDDCAYSVDDYADELGGSERGPEKEIVTIGPECEPIDVEVVIVGGAAVSMTRAEAEALSKPQKTKTEILSDGSTRVHVVKELKTPAKIALRVSRKVRKLISPGTLGELMNVLPYRWETMLTPEEKSFYKDLAACNLSREEMTKKHWDYNEEDILLIENRIVNHAFRMKLVALLPENSSRSVEQQMAENWAREAQLISKTGGTQINGSIQAGKLDRYGRRRALDSFRTAPLTETYGGWQPSEGGRGPDRDDFGDESSA